MGHSQLSKVSPAKGKSCARDSSFEGWKSDWNLSAAVINHRSRSMARANQQIKAAAGRWVNVCVFYGKRIGRNTELKDDLDQMKCCPPPQGCGVWITPTSVKLSLCGHPASLSIQKSLFDLWLNLWGTLIILFELKKYKTKLNKKTPSHLLQQYLTRKPWSKTSSFTPSALLCCWIVHSVIKRSCAVTHLWSWWFVSLNQQKKEAGALLWCAGLNLSSQLPVEERLLLC